MGKQEVGEAHHTLVLKQDGDCLEVANPVSCCHHTSLGLFHLCMCCNVHWCLMCITSCFYMLDGYVCQSVSIHRIVMCVTVYTCA